MGTDQQNVSIQVDPFGIKAFALSIQNNPNFREGHEYVDYLSREPHIDPWPETELYKNFVIASIDSIHKALDGISSSQENNCLRKRNENVLEQPRTKKRTTHVYNKMLKPSRSFLVCINHLSKSILNAEHILIHMVFRN